jgi:hypothetical protein
MYTLISDTVNIINPPPPQIYIRDGPFNFQGGLCFFSKKNILIPNVTEKYSDFGGGKKKI